jgi:phosphoribosylformimino-5-aminoimidazole carboxamide ribotide isomerase
VTGFEESIVPGDFPVIPVLDVRDGQAVHAVGGIRSHYQPLRSILHPSAEPVAVARGYRDILGLRTIYLADLDGISGGPPNERLYRELAELGVHLWIDPGLKTADDVGRLVDLERTSIVIGLETVQGPDAVRAILARAGPDRVVVSLDLFEGVPLFPTGANWRSVDPQRLCHELSDLGVLRFILLDLSRVGTGRGPATAELLAAVRLNFPELELTVGGGIAGVEDVLELLSSGASSVLVGSALHDGRLGTRELDRIEERFAKTPR